MSGGSCTISRGHALGIKARKFKTDDPAAAVPEDDRSGLSSGVQDRKHVTSLLVHVQGQCSVSGTARIATAVEGDHSESIRKEVREGVIA